MIPLSKFLPMADGDLDGLLIFNTSSGASLDPVITAPATTRFIWYWPDGVTRSTGGTPSPTLTQAGKYKIWCSNWRTVTQIDTGTDNVKGFISNLSNYPGLVTFYCSTNQLTGSIPSLAANTALVTFYCSTNQLTDYAGGLTSCTQLTQFRCHNNYLTQVAISAMVDDLYTIRAAIGALSCVISFEGTNNGIPTADAIAKIEGTGAYTGDGLKQAGCTVTYRAS